MWRLLEISSFKAMHIFVWDCPQTALLRPLDSDAVLINFHKARVKAEVVADGILPAYLSTCEVRIDCRYILVDIVQCETSARRRHNRLAYQGSIRKRWLVVGVRRSG